LINTAPLVSKGVSSSGLTDKVPTNMNTIDFLTFLFCSKLKEKYINNSLANFTA